MRQIFYPRNLPCWRDEFYFGEGITLASNSLPRAKAFFDRNELVCYLREKLEFVLINPTTEIRFENYNHETLGFCSIIYAPMVLGFCKEVE